MLHLTQVSALLKLYNASTVYHYMYSSCMLLAFCNFSVCDVGIPLLEDRLENLNIPSFKVKRVKVSR